MARKKMNHDNRVEDRISQLPDAIILHILSFLPTSIAVWTSLLSRRWQRMWTFLPVLDFVDSRDIPRFKGHENPFFKGQYRREERNKFYKLVDECLRRLSRETTVSKFKLSMQYYYGCHSRIDAWFGSLEKHSVKELDVCLLPRSRGYKYFLSKIINNFKALTLLKLSGLNLEFFVPTSLPSLEELYLNKIKMNDGVLDNLLRSFTSLETLNIDRCWGLIDPKVSSSSLRYMEFTTNANDCYFYGCTIEIRAVNLHSFVRRGEFNYKKCGMTLFHCINIRNLSLTEAYLTDRWLEDLIPELPLLESLSLTNCYGFEHVNIWNGHLKHFVYTLSRRFDYSLADATIDAPNLVSFSYSSYKLIDISVNAPNLLDADIAISDHPRKTYDLEWYATLIKFLSEFKSAKSLRVFCSHEKVLIYILSFFHVVYSF